MANNKLSAIKAATTEKATEVKNAVDAKASEVKPAVDEAVKKTTAKASAAAKTVKKSAKKASAKATAKVKAAKEGATTDVFIQYGGNEIVAKEVVARVKEAYISEGHRPSYIKSVQVYIKPEENAAYYVVNQKSAGKIDL